MKDIQWASRLHRCFRLTDFSEDSTENGSFIHWNDSPASFHIFTCKQWFLLHLPHTAVLVILLPMVVRVTLLLLLVLAILLMDVPAILLMAIPVALLLLTEARVIPLLLMAVLAILRLLVVVPVTILRLPRALVCLLPLVATGVVTKRYPACMCLL